MRRFSASLALVLSTACSTPPASSETTTDDADGDSTGGEVPCQAVGDWAGGCCEIEYPCDPVIQTCSNSSSCTADSISNVDAVQCVFQHIVDKDTFAFEVNRPMGGDIQSTTTYWVTGEFFVAWESGTSSGAPLDDWFTCRKAVGPIATPCSTETDPAAALTCIQQVCADFVPLGSCSAEGGGTTTGDGETSTGDGDGDSADGCVFVCGDEGDGGTATTGPIPDAPDVPDPCDNLIEYTCPE
jgi:hypothetical protein